MQAMCSYLRGVLATKSVLATVGVGKENATPLAAAMQWVLRDGSGMLGGLFFAYFFGPKFDANVKFWRLYADVINDIALTLDMCSPLFPEFGTQVLCISSICKSMCGVAAGATRSALTSHFARHDNMADVAAKEGSQETAVNMVGLIFGMYFANLVNDSQNTVWMSFLFLTLFHVYANYQAVSSLLIPTINKQRAILLIESFLSKDNGMSIRSINMKESVTFSNPIYSIEMGAQLERHIYSSIGFQEYLDVFRKENYVLYPSSRSIYVFLKKNVESKDELRGIYHAHILTRTLREYDDSKAVLKKINLSYLNMCNDFNRFYDLLEEQNWRMSGFLFGKLHWRYIFPSDECI